MSVSSCTSLCSSSALARTTPSSSAAASAAAKPIQCLSRSPQFAKSGTTAAAASNLFLSSCRTLSSISLFRSSGSPHLPLKPSISWVTTVKASETTEAKTSNSTKAEEEAEDFYEVELVQPYGLKFRKGRDRGTYIDAIAPGGSADKTGLFTVGDKVIATSAVFGEEIWPAAEYGRTMYTIRQRIGPLLMKMQKRYGQIDDSGELTEKEIIRAERNSGVISNRVREIQMQNYLRRKEQKQQREKDLREGLQLYQFRVMEHEMGHETS